MEDYIHISFWVGVLVTTIRLLVLFFCEYPRKPNEVSVGADVFTLVLSIAWMVYGGYIIWLAPSGVVP